MAEIKKFPEEAVLFAAPHEIELENRIIDLIYEYSGEITYAQVIGVLDFVKSRLIDDA